jgi:hypothetical protein
VDRRIREVDEGGQHFRVATSVVQIASIPQREDGADELDKVLLPLPVCGGAATCMLSVSLQREHSISRRTCICVVKLEEVALLVELVGVTVEESKDAVELGERVCANVHDRRLVRLDHGNGARGRARL